MTEHKQYNLKPPIPQPPVGENSPNVLRVDKDLNVKGQFTVNNTEAENKLGSKVNVKNVDASYAIQLNNFIIAVTNVATARTITLPKPSVAGFGKVFVVKDASGSALTTTITISPNATETIDGDTTKVINTNFGAVGFYTDGVNWFTV